MQDKLRCFGLGSDVMCKEGISFKRLLLSVLGLKSALFDGSRDLLEWKGVASHSRILDAHFTRTLLVTSKAPDS